MEKIYNKLVRDDIPNIIEKDNEIPITRILTDKEYKQELYKKLEEECNEVICSTTKEETIKELADVLEVIKAISELNDSNLDKVINEADSKRKKRGGFQKRIYLEKTIKKDL